MRGRLSSVQQVMIIAGLTGAFLGNYILAHTAGRSTEVLWLGYAAWRWMFWMQIIPASVFLLTLLSSRKARDIWWLGAAMTKPRES